ncbi:MAG: 30S ribosomal protein S20 [Chitinophagales bacterium]
MAKSKTPAKRVLTAEKSRERNIAKKSAMKTEVKKFEAAIAEKNIDNAENIFVSAASIIDKNAGKGIIHKNKAARKKSQLAKKLNQLAKQG